MVRRETVELHRHLSGSDTTRPYCSPERLLIQNLLITCGMIPWIDPAAVGVSKNSPVQTSPLDTSPLDRDDIKIHDAFLSIENNAPVLTVTIPYIRNFCFENLVRF